jgi:hypothetical protein
MHRGSATEFFFRALPERVARDRISRLQRVSRGSVCCLMTLNSTERVRDTEPTFEYNPVLHIFGPQRVTIGVQRRCSNHGIVDRHSVALGKPEPRFVNLDRERLHRRQVWKLVQKLPGGCLVPRRGDGRYAGPCCASLTEIPHQAAFVDFEWDPAKSKRNEVERGLPFELAVLPFDGPTIERVDDRRSYG